ncbi:MAG: hypothetical protein ACI9KE_001304 [Polyangiales bacterium]
MLLFSTLARALSHQSRTLLRMDSHADAAFIRSTIHEDEGLQTIQEDVERHLGGQGFDAGHDLAHSLRVAVWTLRLAPEVVPRDGIAAALLHDVINLPKDHPERSTASAQSADYARQRLPAAGFGDEAVACIAAAVEEHSYSRGLTPTSDLGRALQDADRLETLGSIGLMRVFSTGTRMGARYFHADDPWAEHRELDDLRFSIDHFATKLLGLPSTMNTEAGKREADRRALRLRRFVVDLADELAIEAPAWLGE